MPDTDLILHVEGTTNETKSLPKHVVRQAIAQGQISRSQLIWSPEDNTWKQVRELPHLLPSQKLAPAPPVHRPAEAPQPQPQAKAAVPQPRVSGAPRVAAAAQPKVKVKAPRSHATAHATFPVRTRSKDYRVHEKPHFNPLKWVCIIMAILILGILGFNWVMEEQPLLSALKETAYPKVMVYAHLGGFVQTGALEIHILGTGSLDKTNLTDFLVALAHSTPQANHVFDRISLTSGFMSQYTLPGSSWKEFGDMGQMDEEKQKKFLLDELTDGSGQPLLNFTPTMTPEAQDAAREKAWATFVANFTRS